MMERTMSLAQHLASSIQARLNCQQSGNWDWFARHTVDVETLARDFLPSGIDSGCTVDVDKSTGSKIIVHTAFHHMDESGMYDGWTEHTVTIKPAFSGFDIAVSGRNRNAIKDYMRDTFDIAMRQSVTQTVDGYSPATYPTGHHRITHGWASY